MPTSFEIRQIPRISTYFYCQSPLKLSLVTITLSCMQADLMQPQTARESDCTCPRDGLLAVPEEAHEIKCPTLRADWSRGERLRYWLGGKIPFGGVTSYEGDDSQRPMTSAEHYVEAFESPTPVEYLDGGESTPWYLRLQERVRDEAYGSWPFRPPTWQHLGARLLTLLVEGAVKTRRWLIWLAPVIAVTYIVFDIVRGS